MNRLGCAVEPGRSLPEAIQRAQRAEQLGYDSIWCSQLPGNRDTALVLAAYAQATQRVRLGTAVLPIYTRHPTAIARPISTNCWDAIERRPTGGSTEISGRPSWRSASAAIRRASSIELRRTPISRLSRGGL